MIIEQVMHNSDVVELKGNTNNSPCHMERTRIFGSRSNAEVGRNDPIDYNLFKPCPKRTIQLFQVRFAGNVGF